MKEPHFIVDDLLEKTQNEIRDILYDLNNEETKKKEKVLKTFSYAIVSSLMQEQPETKIENIQKIHELVHIPAGHTIEPTPEPKTKKIHKFKKKKLFKKISKPDFKTIITDKQTNEPLVILRLDKKYRLQEPILSDNDIELLNKVLEKEPKDPKRLWELIEKYSSEQNNKTAIKYYAINYTYSMIKTYLKSLAMVWGIL
jgi:hypothetical protein